MGEHEREIDENSEMSLEEQYGEKAVGEAYSILSEITEEWREMNDPDWEPTDEED